MENFTQWSDSQLLLTAIRYGEEARTWRNKFLGLLPEIHRRKLYEQKDFTSITHFAKVIAGVGEEQVRDVIRFEERLREMPALHNLLVQGKVSMHKIEKVLPVVEPENDIFLADQVQLLSCKALSTLAKDIKYADVKITDVRNEPILISIAVLLSKEIAEELLELKEKGIDIDAELKQFLEQRKKKIEEEKEKLATSEPAESRHIPSRTRRLLAQEHGTKCAKPGCSKPSQHIHHTARFALTRSHDPHYLAPLCKNHHQIAHTIDQKYQAKKGKA